MAGSYNHCIDNEGNLLSNEQMMLDGAMIENLGDAYEAIEEMYGMIWWLASNVETVRMMPAEAAVEMARQHYKDGLVSAKVNKNKRKQRP